MMIHVFIGKFQPLSLTFQLRLMLEYSFLTTLFNDLFPAPAYPSKKVIYGSESTSQPLAWCSRLCFAPINFQVPLEGAALACTLCPRLHSEPDQEGMHRLFPVLDSCGNSVDPDVCLSANIARQFIPLGTLWYTVATVVHVVP